MCWSDLDPRRTIIYGRRWLRGMGHGTYTSFFGKDEVNFRSDGSGAEHQPSGVLVMYRVYQSARHAQESHTRGDGKGGRTLSKYLIGAKLSARECLLECRGLASVGSSLTVSYIDLQRSEILCVVSEGTILGGPDR